MSGTADSIRLNYNQVVIGTFFYFHDQGGKYYAAFGGVRPRISPIITPPATTTVPIAPIIIFLLLSIGSSFFICNKIIIPETHGQGLKKNLQIREGKEKTVIFFMADAYSIRACKESGGKKEEKGHDIP